VLLKYHHQDAPNKGKIFHISCESFADLDGKVRCGISYESRIMRKNMSENNEEQKSAGTNLRQHQKNDDKKMLYVVIFVLVVLGSGLIGLIFGWEAWLASIPCLLGGALLILVPWGLLTLVEKWRDGMDV